LARPAAAFGGRKNTFALEFAEPKRASFTTRVDADLEEVSKNASIRIAESSASSTEKTALLMTKTSSGRGRLTALLSLDLARNDGIPTPTPQTSTSSARAIM
jgi:Tfp pilus tip-associated adhesin PilY1